jgi:hypothetical protein
VIERRDASDVGCGDRHRPGNSSKTERKRKKKAAQLCFYIEIVFQSVLTLKSVFQNAPITLCL